VKRKEELLCDDLDACLKAAEFMSMIGNQLRIAIVCYLTTGEKTVTEISNKIQKPHSQTSFNLSKLYSSGWVTKRREGNTVYYSLNDNTLKTLLESIKNKFIKKGRGKNEQHE